MSIREGARLQSFPDNYQFYGSDSMKRLEIGNAVPPLLSMAIAKKIAKQYPPALWASKMTIIEGELEQYDVVALQSRMRKRGNEELLGPDPNRRECAVAKLEKREPVFDPAPFERWKNLK